MNGVFLDTSYFKALIDSLDDFHTVAIGVFADLEKEEAELVTSNFVVDESLTLLRVKCGLDAAIKFRDILNAGAPTLTIFRVTADDEALAWTWFIKRWKHLSFTDCVWFAVMERLGIRRAAAFDRHFSQAGFEMVSVPSP